MTEYFFAPCPRGLEGVLVGELERLGGAAVTATDGGVGFAGALPYAEAGNAYAATSRAANAFARMPTKADAARNDLFDRRWSVWGAAYGGGADIDGNAAVGSNSASVRVGRKSFFQSTA